MGISVTYDEVAECIPEFLKVTLFGIIPVTFCGAFGVASANEVMEDGSRRDAGIPSLSTDT